MKKMMVMSWSTHYYVLLLFFRDCKVDPILLIKTAPRILEIFPWTTTRPAFPAFCSSNSPTDSNVPANHDDTSILLIFYFCKEGAFLSFALGNARSQGCWMMLTWFQCLKTWHDAGQVLEAFSLQCLSSRCGPSANMQQRQ
jgi:hypothetical protein